VFSTKDRKPLIPENRNDELHSYIAQSCRNHGCFSVIVGGVEDHVHITCTLPRTITVSKLLEEIKSCSSKWMKEFVPTFQWQRGYGAFSISPSHHKRVVEYISTQKEHHKELSFKDEFRKLCDKYEIEYNETYLWE